MSWLTASKTYVAINITDWIDIALVVMTTRDRDVLDFYITAFPEKITQGHIDLFWKEQGLLPGTAQKMEEAMEEFIDVLKENDKFDPEDIWVLHQ